MGERRGTKGLELWCKRMTEGYPGVKIDNMTTSWRNGLAFCAIIHHFRPELIDFKKLKKEDVYANNELAFRVAEQYLGIPALLEAEDMVEYLVPDRLSILTYLSQFYQAFAVTQGSPSRMVPKRPANSTGIVSPASTSPPNKKMSIPGGDVLRLKPCAKCTLPVFFAERLNVGKLLYHRTCFRCARCNNQLTLANSYETETPNQYCCETCPDEESAPTGPDNISVDKAASTILSRSLSDEEKTAGLKSSMFETALEEKSLDFKRRESSAGIARKSFLQMSMLTAYNNPSDDGEVQVPDLPRSARPSVVVLSEFRNSEHQSDIIDVDVNSNRDSGRPHSAIDNVHSSSVNSRTKDVKVQSATAEDFSGSSMVKARMRIFEKKCDPQPFTTKVTEIDLSKVTKQKVTIVEDDEFNNEEKQADFEQVDHTSLNVVDQSDSINLVIKENTEDVENVQADSTYKSIITISDETVSLPEDKLSKTQYKTAREDSIISISDESHISGEPDESNFLKLDNSSFDDKLRNTQYLTTTEHSILSISEESDILQEPIKSECADLDKEPLDGGSSETPYKISSEMPICDVSHEISSQLDQSVSNDENNISLEDRLSKNEYKITYEDHNTNDPTNVSELEPSLNNLSAEDKSENIQDLPLLPKTENVQINIEEITSNVELDSGLQSMQPSTIEESSTRESYPGELNPFGDDEDVEKEDISFQKQSSSNPFDEDEDECGEQQEVGTPPPFRRLIKLHDEDKISFTPEHVHITRVSEVYRAMSTLETTPEFKKPVPVIRKKLPAPKISLTPFWDIEDEDSKTTPRQPRSSVDQTFPQPQSRPRASDVSSSIVSAYGSSTTSLSSITTTSSVQSGKKKKAPAPPKPPSSSHDSEQNSLTSSPSTSVQHSPGSTPRPRKSKKAPAAPPALASTPSGLIAPHSKMSISPIQFDNTKVAKNEVNRNRQSQTLNEPTSPTAATHLPDKSMYGKWKRKKSMAPDKPVAIRRTIKELPMVEVKRELDIIELQQQGLERQGVKLEHIIRMRCESSDSELNEDNIPIEVEDMILQLFEVVNEKNELCRRQAELMYLKKQHRLDEEHAEVEYQIRCLMLMPDQNKTDTDKSKEEELIKRLLEIVEKKNEIIECLDMDRVREHEEDHSFTSSMNSYANRRDAAATITTSSNNDEKQLSKKEKKKFKKKFKLKIGGSHQQVDADKDIDETEVNQAKEKRKKKFAIF